MNKHRRCRRTDLVCSCSWWHTMWYTTKVEKQFRIIFERLNAVNTQEALASYV